MTNVEIDKRIAREVMGWKVRKEYDPNGSFPQVTEDYEDWLGVLGYEKGESLVLWKIPRGAGEPWSPSTRIEHAQQVWEKMAEDGFDFMLRRYGTERFYTASFDAWDKTIKDKILDPFGEFTTKSAPESICRAALQIREDSDS